MEFNNKPKDVCDKDVHKSVKDRLGQLAQKDTGNLPSKILLCPGIPIALTTNIDNYLKLSNGATGTYRGLVFERKQPICALVEMDNDVSYNLDKLPPKVVPIYCKTSSFTYQQKTKDKSRKPVKFKVSRHGLPIIEDFVRTDFKEDDSTVV